MARRKKQQQKKPNLDQKIDVFPFLDVLHIGGYDHEHCRARSLDVVITHTLCTGLFIHLLFRIILFSSVEI